MNSPYPIPVAISTNPWYFYSCNLDSIGVCDKPLDARIKFTIDYTQLTPTFTVSNVWFEIDPGGAPALTIDSCIVSGTLVTFFLAGGYSDTEYLIRINAVQSDSSVHTDFLTVNVVGEDGCACCTPAITNASNYIQFPATNVFVNHYPRFFVSATAPTNANLLDRWYNLIDGNWYDYVTNGVTDFWIKSILGIAVSPPPGGGPDTGITGSITIKKMQPLNFDGTTTTFTLIATDGYTPNVTTSHSLFVSLDGVWQEPETQFTASGNYITFVTPPPHDSYEFIMWIYGGITSG